MFGLLRIEALSCCRCANEEEPQGVVAGLIMHSVSVRQSFNVTLVVCILASSLCNGVEVNRNLLSSGF